jgi:hypothetical protein
MSCVVRKIVAPRLRSSRMMLRRALASAAGSEKTENLARRDVERQAFDGGRRLAVGESQAFNGDHASAPIIRPGETACLASWTLQHEAWRIGWAPLRRPSSRPSRVPRLDPLVVEPDEKSSPSDAS